MDIRNYLDNKLPKRISDLAKYLSSYSIATGISLLTKCTTSAIFASQEMGPAEISVGSSVLCTGAFFGTRWPLYHWLHEKRYDCGESSIRDRKIELTTTIISSVVTNGVSIGAQYALIKYYNGSPALTGLVSQIAGGGTGADTKITLDWMLGLVFPSDKSKTTS